MKEKRFDPKKLDKLNNPRRLKDLPPEFIQEKAKIKNPKVIIDLGAGTGFFSIPFAEKYSKAKVYACDISEVMIEWMKENISPKFENITPLKMGNNNVPLKDEIADFIYMINLHHELDNPEEALKECYRLLKPNGKIAISDWKKEKNDYGPPFEFRCNESDVKEQLLKIHFKQVEIYNDLKTNYLIIAEK